MINYTKVNEGKGWAKGVPFNPTNATNMENGIKAACDGVDRLESVPSDLQRNGVGEVSGGRNLWDEQWELGDISNTGKPISATDRIRSANFIKVKPNTTYFVQAPTTVRIVEYVSNTANGAYGGLLVGAFTTSENTNYIKFYVNPTYGTSYKHDLAIIEGTSGTYEPYFESNKMLTDDTNEIASLKFLGWTVPREMPVKNYVGSDGKFHQRVGRVDLGSLSWAITSGNFYANSAFTRKLGTANAYCTQYEVNSAEVSSIASATVDKRIYFQTNNADRIIVRDTSYTTVDAFKSSLTGKYLYYPLATEVVISEGDENIVCEKPIKYLFGRYGLRDSATAKSKFAEMPIGLTIIYDINGYEGIFLYVKSASNFGTITFWSADRTYTYRLRYYNGTWQSTDWEQV